MDLKQIIERSLAAGREAVGSSLQAEVLLHCLAPGMQGIVVTAGIDVHDGGPTPLLNGMAPAALWHGGQAQVLVLAGTRLFTLPSAGAGVSIAPADSLDGLPAVRVELRNQAATPRALDDAALAPARIALAAEMAGAARAALDLALQRARSRRIFGKPIGTFQALSHRLADAFMDVEAMELALQEAVNEGGAGDGRALKALCGEAARRVTATAQQVWSGEGYHADQPLTAFTRRVLGLSLRLGSPDDDYRSLACATP